MDIPINIILIGAAGRLGKEIQDVCHSHSDYHILEKVTRESPHLSNLDKADVILDVSSPQSLEKNLPIIAESGTPLVIGSTGHTDETLELIKEYAKRIPILHCQNFAPGIAVIKKMLSQLPKVKSISISEIHHAEKKDAPSGTAKALASLLDVPNEKISSKREQETIGDHKVEIELEGEKIEVSHKALSRDVFAKGALDACKYIKDKDTGLYHTHHD